MKNRFLIISLILIFVAFAVRVIALADASVWWDEAWSVWVAQQSFDQTTLLTAQDVHPPLYQWGLHIWVRLVGISEFAVRMFSVIWSVLTVAVINVIARRIGNQRVAVMATIFAALSVFAIHWAQETRMYAQAAFFSALATYAYLRVRHAKYTGLAWWGVLIVAGASVALTHYLGAVVLVILNIHWLLTLHQRPLAFHRRWIIAMLSIGVILLLWGAYALELVRRSGSVPVENTVGWAWHLFATLLVKGNWDNIYQFPLITHIAKVGFLGGLVLYARQRGEQALLIFLMVILPPLVIYSSILPDTGFYTPKPQDRYMLLFMPLAFAGIGIMIDQFARLRYVGYALAGVASISLLWLYGTSYLQYVDERYVVDEYATMIQTVDQLAREDDTIFFMSDDRYPLVYYHFNRIAEDNYSDRNIRGIVLPETIEESRLQWYTRDVSRFWVIEIERHFQDPDGESIAWFNANYERIYHEDINHNGITLYAEEPTSPPTSDDVLAPVVDEIRPLDTIRIGSPDDVIWRYDDTVLQRNDSDRWQLSRWKAYLAYPNGTYEIQTQNQTYTFELTHSQSTPDEPQVSLDADFGDLTLVGYDVLPPTIQRGEKVDVRLYWHVDTVPDENYTVFSHLLNIGTVPVSMWASDDSYPADTPTTLLWEGLTFTDTHTLAVPDDVPAGQHQLAFGLYQLETGERLTLPDGRDMVVVDVEVR